MKYRCKLCGETLTSKHANCPSCGTLLYSGSNYRCDHYTQSSDGKIARDYNRIILSITEKYIIFTDPALIKSPPVMIPLSDVRELSYPAELVGKRGRIIRDGSRCVRIERGSTDSRRYVVMPNPALANTVYEEISKAWKRQRLSEPEEEPAVETVNDEESVRVRKNFCQNCGSRLNEGDVFCAECGSKV